MRRKLLIFIIITYVLAIFPSNIYATDDEIDFSWMDEIIETAGNVEEINILSRHAVVYDRKSKEVLYGKNEEEKVPMASTTKIMTAIVLVENVNLNEEVEVCKEAAMVGGSTIDLKKGDKISYNDLLYGLMLESGNDAATQIAISLAGSIESFANLMNKKAEELELKNTHFVTPHGLDEESHYTTALELAKIADYALINSKIAEVVSTKQYTITVNGYPRVLTNTNELLGYLNGVNGVKTGFTNGAGRCLVTSVKRGDFEIITVVLGADTKKIRTKDSINLIEYTYRNYELIDLEKLITEEFENWGKANLGRIYIDKAKKNNINVALKEYEIKMYPIRKDEVDKISIDTRNNNFHLEAPVKAGYEFASIVVEINKKRITEIPIILSEEIERKNVLDYMRQIVKINYLKAS